MEGECCKEECNPANLIRNLTSCVKMAETMKADRGIGGREIAIVLHHCEDALMRAERYQQCFEDAPCEPLNSGCGSEQACA